MRTWYRNLDYPAILLWLGLCAAGLVAIFSATHGGAQEFLLGSVQKNFEHQFVWLGICAVGLVIALLIPVQQYRQMAYPVYIVSLLLLVGALVFGREVSGARSWIYLGPFGFQSSELAKAGALLAVAQLLSSRPTNARTFWYVLATIALLLVPAALIVLQNDTGTALVFVGLAPILLFWSGLSLVSVLLMISPAIAGYLTIVYWPAAVLFAVVLTTFLYLHSRSIRVATLAAIFTGGTAATAYFALSKVLKPHQVARILSFANPEAEEFRSGVGFHLLQSKAAVGSGGLYGQGFMQGTQTQGRYIPEQSTDFIFSVIGEEWGFIGAMAVLLLFAVFIIRLVRMAAQVKHPFGSIVAAGAAGMILIHVFVNIGMVLGLLPVIGIPLPFLSYGGSALLSNTAMLAMALSLHMRRDDFSAYSY